MTKSLDAILDDFDPNVNHPPLTAAGGSAMVAIWLPKEYKATYDRLQQATSRRFSRKLRELIMAAIDATNSRAS